LPITLTLTTTPADRVEADLLVVPVFADRQFGPGTDLIDNAIGGTLPTFMEEAGFAGKADETLAVPTNGRIAAKAALLLGLGPRAEVTAASLRKAGAALARRARTATSVVTTVLDAAPDTVDRAAAAQAFAEGIALGNYQFLEYKTKAEPSKLERVEVRARGGARVQSALDRGTLVSGAVSWARDIVNQPAAAKSPAAFADAAKRLLRGKGVTVKVLAGPELRAEGLGGIVGVGQGSEQPPRLVKVSYSPPGARGSLALVGKGVVFDSGGLSIKTASGMETMKTDMSGAAAVLATMSVLKALGVRAKVTAYVPMVENMPSGTAIRPGDVLKIRNGKTVEVLNTDAEGRLILADALSLAAEDAPDAMIDLATLTGACMVALGDKIAGLMGNREPWVVQVREAADRAGESVWPLPLPQEYRKQIDSEIADVKNIGSSYGGALTAGLFLEEFVGDVTWAHLDIAGPARASSDDGELVKGGTGFGVRTLVELASTFRRPARR
jgi:leucyl aminopeptidase